MKIFLIALLLLPATIQAQLISTIAGGGASLGDGEPATAANLDLPYFVRSDGSGNIYIADVFNHRIRKINASGLIATIAGNGTTVHSGDGGQATAAGISYPSSVAVDSAGNLYIAEYGGGLSAPSWVRKVNTSGIISTIVGNGMYGYGGDGGQATAAGFGQIQDIAVDAAGNIYIADFENYRVRKVNATGIITTIAVCLNLYAVAVDGVGSVYFSSYRNNIISKMDTTGTITTIAGCGIAGYSDGPATEAEINNPHGIAVDKEGNVYFADNGNERVRKIRPAGLFGSTIITIAGTGYAGYGGDGGLATAAWLHNPYGVAVDGSGNVYIVDQGNECIRKISNSNTAINSIPNTLPSIEVYPNPIKNEVNIISTDKIINVEITNIIGQRVLNQIYNSRKVHVSLEGLPAGLYFIRVNNWCIQKIVKN